MKHLALALVVAVAVGGAGCLVAAEPGAGAAPKSATLPGGTWASIATLPDWSGAWEPLLFAPPRPGEGPPLPPPAPPKLTPAYAAQYAAFQEKNRTTPGINFVSEVANCVPAGLPGSMQQPYPLEFLFTPGRVTIAIETYSVVRRIHTDGRPLPADPDPTYQGSSIGHWEGDTLVVETTGVLPETSVLAGTTGHSDRLRITERMHLVAPDVLEITTTRDDPSVFLEPYTTTLRYRRHRDWEIMEYVCAQNNRDQLDAQGHPQFDLERKH
jgi:hypothetical protein